MASKRELAFILYYTGEARFNGAEAARLAGYAEESARQTAHKLLTKDYIQAAVKERFAELTMSADEVLIRLTEHGRSDLGKFIELTSEQIAAHPETRLIQEFDREIISAGGVKQERIKLKLYSAQAALLQLWKHHQLAQGKTTESVEVVDAKERLAQLLARQSGRAAPGDDPGAIE